MSITHRLIITLVQKIVAAILPIVSEEIRKELVFLFRSLYTKAKETENPWDDFAVKFIAELLNIPLED